MSEKIQRYLATVVAVADQCDVHGGDMIFWKDHESAINDTLETAKADRKKLTDDWVAYVDTVREDFKGRIRAIEASKEKLADKCTKLGIVALVLSSITVILTLKIWL